MLTSQLTLAAAITLLASPALHAQPLPTDPSLITGSLDNGLTYIIKQHNNPPGRAVVWIHMHTGSLNESDKQRGLAHYLEHMAFNGSEHFPPGSVVPFFQSLGMTFGRDQNAFTNFDQTTYQLTLPKADTETLAKGMTFFSDVLSKLSLLPAEVDAERGIIQEERRRGLSGRQRTMYEVMERMTPGSLYGKRITIGTEESIASVTPQDFRDYYGKWYSASNATLIVIADSAPDAVLAVIKDKFGSAPKRPRPVRQDINVRAYDKSFAIVTTDPEIRSEDIRIVRLEPARPPVTTVPQYRSELVERLGSLALNRRIDAKVAAGSTSYLSARAGSGTSSNAIYTAEISCRPQPGKWKEALNEMALELQRGRAFGFTARELDEVKKQFISSAERAVETEPTAQASALVSRINGRISAGEPITSPQQNLDLLKSLLPTITPEEVSKRFAAEFDPKAVAFIAVLPSTVSIPTEAELLALGTAALAATPTPDTEATRATELMAALPKSGEVAAGAKHEPSQVWSGWLSNNTRVHYRFMDTRKNEVSINISLIGGELLETASNRGITRAAELAWSRPATKHLSSTDIRDLMNAKKISVRGGGGFGGGGRGGGGRGGGGGGADSISLSISGSPEELETGFQLAHLLLTEPKIEPASFTQFQTNTKTSLQEADKNPGSTGARLVGAAPYPDTEPRTRPLTVEDVDRLTPDAAQAWLDKLIAQSPIEVTIVGDLPREQALELTARYLGSLPARDKVSPETYGSIRKLARPAGPRVIRKTIDTPTPQAFAYCGFYGADETNREDSRALAMAARVLSTRMVKEVREEAQLVYSISASSRPASVYPGFGLFSAGATADPAKAEALIAKLTEMYETFAKNGPTEDEMDIARKQFANTFQDQVKEPGYWSSNLRQLTFRNGDLDDIVHEPEAFQALTAEQVKSTFARYFAKNNMIIVVVTPQAATDKPSASR